MPQIIEHFVLRLSDEGAARDARRAARRDFLALPGVRDWRTARSVSTEGPTLFVETFLFDGADAAKAAGARFSQMDRTRAFLGFVEETLVGQHFVDVTEDGTDQRTGARGHDG